MKIVGISGKAESGKDTAAGFIAAVHDKARRTAFADDLKVQAIKLWVQDEGKEWPFASYIHLLDEDRLLQQVDNLKTSSPSFRTFLQEFGQRYREEKGLDYWINRALARHEERHGNRPMLITDVRYPNEAEAVLSRRGILLRIERPGHQNKLTPEQKAHPSETALDDFDRFTEIITNDGDPVNFLNWVLRATRGYL